MHEVVALGFDLSLTRSGVARVGPEGIECFSMGRKGKRDEPLKMRHSRIFGLAHELVEAAVAECDEPPLIAAIEDNPFGARGGSAHDRSGLWWQVYHQLNRRSIPVMPVNVSKVKIYATGRGNKHEKDEVMLSIVRRYPDAPIQNNDEADATVLAMMGARLVGRPYEASLPQTHLRAMSGLEVP